MTPAQELGKEANGGGKGDFMCTLCSIEPCNECIARC
jgi:hypothetical protein